MRALSLDFRRQDSSASWIGIALLLAALAAAVASGGHYLNLADQLAAEQASLREAASAARKKPVAVAAAGSDPKALAMELKNANEILMQLSLPWGDLFASAEAGTPDVALLGIESETGKRRVKISGEAKNLESILDYLRYLESRPVLGDVYLQSHELQKQDSQQPMRFVVTAQWRVRK